MQTWYQLEEIDLCAGVAMGTKGEGNLTVHFTGEPDIPQHSTPPNEESELSALGIVVYRRASFPTCLHPKLLKWAPSASCMLSSRDVGVYLQSWTQNCLQAKKYGMPLGPE